MATYNHTGQVVTDLARAKRFYQEVLGFSPSYEITPPDEATAKLCCLEPPLGVTASYLTLDGFVLELMQYAVPGATAPYTRRAMNQPGLTHLSISVDDVRKTATRAVEYGGEIVEESRRRRRPVHPRPRRSAARVAAGGLSGRPAAQTLRWLLCGVVDVASADDL